MKNTNVCPKCHNKRIRPVEIVHELSIVLEYNKWSGFKNANLIHLICLDCGYIETWIKSPEELEKVRLKYE